MGDGISGGACMWRANLIVHIHVALLMIMEINVRMPLICSHFWCVLLDVHCALHSGVDEVGKAIPTAIVAPDHIPTEVAE